MENKCNSFLVLVKPVSEFPYHQSVIVSWKKRALKSWSFHTHIVPVPLCRPVTTAANFPHLQTNFNFPHKFLNSVLDWRVLPAHWARQYELLIIFLTPIPASWTRFFTLPVLTIMWRCAVMHTVDVSTSSQVNTAFYMVPDIMFVLEYETQKWTMSTSSHCIKRMCSQKLARLWNELE